MQIIMAIVSSLDGRLTRGDDPDFHKWTSIEDKREFEALIAKHNLIVMGGKTYEAARKRIRIRPGKLRVVLTRDPSEHAAEEVEGQLEFTNLSPAKLIKQLERRGYKNMLLVGGQVNTLFLEAGLVDEIYWTLEPLILGEGRLLVPEKLLGTHLRLQSSEKLNSQGTLLLRYEVVK